MYMYLNTIEFGNHPHLFFFSSFLQNKKTDRKGCQANYLHTLIININNNISNHYEKYIIV